MQTSVRLFLIVTLASGLLWSGAPSSATVDNREQADALLQTYLNLYEIEQETKRLEAKEATLKKKIAATKAEQQAQKVILDSKKQRAGKVLNTYYLGERDGFWSLLFSSKSLADALYVFDTLNTLYMNDFRRLEQYLQALDKYDGLLAALGKQQRQLADNRRQLQTEQARVQALQKQLTAELASRPNATEWIAQLQAFAKQWQTQGLPTFHQYFSQMAKTVSGLPNYILQKQQFRGTTLFVTDRQLNEFLRARNPLFNNMEVKFADRQVKVTGQAGGTSFRIAGQYRIVQQPKHALRFLLSEVGYQQYELPDTTLRYLAELYDLSIYPAEFNSSATIEAITIEDGKLSLRLKVDLFSLF